MHPGMKRTMEGIHNVMHEPIYDMTELAAITPKHRAMSGIRDHIAFYLCQLMRTSFDVVTRYEKDKVMTESHWLRRVLFLETVAGVPGMVAGMLRHLRSLRTMERDNGWIYTLLEEAENERMHLMTFMEIRKATPALRGLVFIGQGVMFNVLFLSYCLSPKTCHRFVGYLEEEAVKTYTHLLQDIDTPGSEVARWNTMPAPALAIEYWQLEAGATLRDVVMVVRADEACHSHVNHTMSSLDADEQNPFRPCTPVLPPTMKILKPVLDNFTKESPNKKPREAKVGLF